MELSTFEKPGVFTSFILDTGSQANVITAKRAQQIGVTHIRPYDRFLIGGIIEGDEINAIGSVWIHLEIGSHVVPIYFLVLIKMAIPAILGMDFMKQHIESMTDNFEYGIFNLNVGRNQPFRQDDRVHREIHRGYIGFVQLRRPR